MKRKLKSFGIWAVTFLLCFAAVYLIVFIGGWKLFESADPILIEIGAALILSVFVFAFVRVINELENRIKTLEKRLDDMEK